MVKRVVLKCKKRLDDSYAPYEAVCEGLKTMITEIKAKGFQLGTVSNLMSEKRIGK